MYKHRKAALLSLLAAMTTLIACNSEGEEEEPQRCFETSLANCGAGPWDPFGIALAFAWWGGSCTEEVACAADAPQTDLTAGIVTDHFIRTNWTTNNAEEREPNNVPAEAMPYLIEDDGSFLINGSVNDVNDPADYVVFATESFDLHAIYLCATGDDCLLPFYQGDAIYIELRDQNGSVLQSTQFAQTANGHEILYMPSPGLRYFAVVRAANTDSADFDYKLVITD